MATRTASAASSVSGVSAANAARTGAGPCSYKRSLRGCTQPAARGPRTPGPEDGVPHVPEVCIDVIDVHDLDQFDAVDAQKVPRAMPDPVRAVAAQDDGLHRRCA